MLDVLYNINTAHIDDDIFAIHHPSALYEALTKYCAGYQCRQPSHIAEGRRVQRVDAGQFRDPSSAGQGSDVVHSPQNQLTVNGVWVVESPCSCITKLLPVGANVGEILFQVDGKFNHYNRHSGFVAVSKF